MTAESLRVLLVLGTSTGGIGQHVRSLAEGLVDRGHRVVVAGPEQTDATFGFGQTGARFVTAPIGVTPSWRDLRVSRMLSHWARGADLVHAHGFRAGLVALEAGAGRTRRVPLVVTWHNAVLADGLRGIAMRGIEGLVARGATLTVGASADLVEEARTRGANAVLGPVAAPRRPGDVRPRDEVRAALGVADAPMVLAVGRLHPQKDYPTMLRAMARLQGREPRPVLVIAGDGPDEASVRRQIEELGVQAKLLGRRSDVHDLLGAADIFVLSSLWEARALVVQEAMQAGLPVVATAVGGLPELVGAGATLVPPRDPEPMASAVARLLDDPPAAAELGRAAQDRAAAWPDEDAVVEQLLALYRSVAPQEPAP